MVNSKGLEKFEVEEARTKSISSNFKEWGDNIDNSPSKKNSKSKKKWYKKCCRCFKKKKYWEPLPQENVFKSTEVAETKDPTVYRILEYKFWDALFVFSCLASVFLFFFCEGFMIQSRFIWGIIHAVNALYAILLLMQWVAIVLKSKYSQSGFTKMDVIFSILSLLPIDLIVLLVHSLNEDDASPEEKAANEESHLTFTISRVHYILRIKNILNYLSGWENQLILGDFYSFLLRILLYLSFLLHFFACIWHRIACNSIRPKHFLMEPSKARADLCSPDSWMMQVIFSLLHFMTYMRLAFRHEANNGSHFTPFLRSDYDKSILWDHYAVSIYWATSTAFRMGYGDLEINMVNTYELLWTSVVQIVSWIFVLAVVNGTLTSLLIESDTERESYLTRRFAINHYLSFSTVGKSIVHEVKKFYDYLWSKRKGVSELQLVEFMPAALKSEIFFDIHKFVLEQMPLFQDLEASFLMTLSVRMTHSFHLTGETLFQRNERGNHMYYVLKGHLEIMSADESHPIACIKSGSAIGDIFLVHPYSHACTVRCGSECDVLALTRESVKEVLRDYPQYTDILQRRAQERFDQCVLLLSLAKKYNEAPKFFARLPYEMPMPDMSSTQREVQDENKAKPEDDILTSEVNAADADGLSLTSTLVDKLSTMLQTALAKKEKKMEKRRKSAQEEAFAAFAGDVNRTILLAKDLGIGRAPLTITTPANIVTRDSKDNLVSGDNESILMKLKHMPILNGEERTEVFLCWKFFVSLCVCGVLFYYPYQLAFRRTDKTINEKYDGAMHLTDLVFALDFVIDMLQIVVTPQRTLETVSEIIGYRVRSFIFYVRLISFLPLEYILGPAAGLDIAASAYYYLFKSNRFLEMIVLYQFLEDLEGVSKIPIMTVFLTKFFLATFYVIHFFAVSYEFILRDYIPNHIDNGNLSHLANAGDHEQYSFVLYWSTQVVTTAGFGDIPYFFECEVVILCLAFVTGTIVATYLGAKLAAILANAQRRRISFTQTYYGVTAFLKQRKFPEDLARRIKAYYHMQWKAHEGVLIPKERSAIWDAPEAIISEVALSQALRYMTRVPLVKHTSENVLRNMCTSLKQYFVPPDECVLFEGDKRRELYIIVKGYCNVYRGTQFIGHLSEGNYFGLSGLIMGVNLDYRITTETHCLFFCLQFDDFVEIAKKHKFLRKDYRLLRGETPFDKLENIVTEPNHKWDDLSTKGKLTEDQLEKPSEKPYVGKKSRKKNCSFLRMLLLRRTFLPSGKLISLWVILRVMAAASVSYYVLAQVAFAFDPEVTFITVLVLDIIAWIDMYFMLHVAYHNEFNQLVTDPIKTAQNYLTGPFALDLFTSFPFEYFVIIAEPGISVFPSDYQNVYLTVAVLRLNRVLQLYKLIQLGVTLNKTISKSLTLYTLIEVMPWMLISLHILACISVGIVCYVSPNGDDFTCSSSAWLTHGLMYKGSKGPDLHNPLKLYVIAIYWTITTALRVGFGDIDLMNTENRLISVFLIMTGVMVTTYLSSKLTACMVGEDSRRIEIRTKIDIMYSFLDKYKASRSVKRRVKEIYYNEWDKTKGISVDHLFEALHPSLKADVMSHLYEESIRRSPILKNLDEPGIRMLASILKEVFLVEGEYIFKYGNITDDVFLVSSGIVSAYNVKGEVMSYMGAGSLIGEISALYGVTRLYTAVAATDVDILVFNSEDFLDFLELYPDLKDQLEQLCENMGQGQEGFLGPPVDVVYPTENSNLDPYTRLENTISASSPKQRVRKNQRIPKNQDEGTAGPGPTKAGTGPGPRPRVNAASRNPMCLLDPLRVPLKHDQLNDEERELMLQDSDASDKKWWSVFVTFGRVPKTEMGILLHIFQDKKRCNCLNFTIHPASPITRGSGWCVFNLLITAISCALTAYEIAFTNNEEGESYTIAGLRYTSEIFFITRIIGNFHLGYNDDSGVLITDVKKISKRYCTRFDGFILDMITTFPFYCISYIIGGSQQHVYAANMRGIQLLRVVLFVRYLGETNNDLGMKASEIKIFKITILLCFIFHFCACAWYLVACYGLQCKKDSWMSVLLRTLLENKSINDTNDITIVDRYWISLSYVTTTITSTGFNNVTPRTVVELIATVGIIFGTVFVIGYLLGEMTQCLASQISRKIHYEHELSVVESHLSGLGLNKSKRETVADYYKLVWKRFRGMPYYSLLRELPYPLRADICFEIYESNLKNARVLGTVDDQVLRQLTARIRHEFYLPGGYIVRGGNVCDAMYFVKRGEVLIIDQNMGIELCVETLYENDCFGEVKILLPREAYRFSYVARVESEVGMLKRDDLDEVLKNFPGLRNDLMDKIRSMKYHRHSDKYHDDLSRGTAGKEGKIVDKTSQKTRLSRKYPPEDKYMKPKDMKEADIAKIETIAVPQQNPNFQGNANNFQRNPNNFQGNANNFQGNNINFPVSNASNRPQGTRKSQSHPTKKNEQKLVTFQQVDPLAQTVQKGLSLPDMPKNQYTRDAQQLQPYPANSRAQPMTTTGIRKNTTSYSANYQPANNTQINQGPTQQLINPTLFEYVPRSRNPAKSNKALLTPVTPKRNPKK